MMGVFAQETPFLDSRSRNLIFLLGLLRLSFVLLRPTTNRILLGFAAAPPHSPAPFFVVRPTGPVVVFLVVEFFVAILADAFLGVKPLATF